MKERSIEALPGSGRGAVYGHASCGYACAGCPPSAEVEGLLVRIVGWSPALREVLARHPRRSWEIAAGQLPNDIAAWRSLYESGVCRAVTPLFTVRLAESSEDVSEVLAAHDAESGCPGSASAALAALEMARDCGLEAIVLAVRSRAGGMPSPGHVRVLQRLAWARRLGFAVGGVRARTSPDGVGSRSTLSIPEAAPPCVPHPRDYNQLHA